MFHFSLNELLVVGALLLCGTLAGQLLGKLRFPTVTSYMLLGVVAGPSVLGILGHGILDELQLVLDIALGLILFHVGGQLDFGPRGRARLRLAGRIGGLEALLTWVAILGALLAAGASAELALAAAAIGCSTSPAVILMIVRQFRSQGPLTDGLLASAAADNAISFTLFALALPFLHAQAGVVGLEVLLHPIWLFTGSLLLGGVLGAILGVLENRTAGDPFLLQIGTILVAIGAARSLSLSPLATSLAVGSAAVSISRTRQAITEFGLAEPPFFVLLFVIAGARLHLADLVASGLFGAVLVGARLVAKFVGGFLGGAFAGYPRRTAAWTGVGLAPMAGMAIGLATLLQQLHPELGGSVASLVLGAVAVFEAIGPPLAELAMIRAGEVEAGTRPSH